MPASDVREVIARAVYESKPSAHHNRKPVAWDDLPHFGWSSWQPNHLNRADAILTALQSAGYGVVRIDREPDAPEITEAMIRAGYDKFGDLGWHDSHEEEEASIHADLRAVLEAAMKARR